MNIFRKHSWPRRDIRAWILRTPIQHLVSYVLQGIDLNDPPYSYVYMMDSSLPTAAEIARFNSSPLLPAEDAKS